MSVPSYADIVIPSLIAGIITVLWATIVLGPTYQIAKWVKYKWLGAVLGWLAALMVGLGGIAAGTIAWLLYWAGFKNADINALMYPDGSSTGVDAFFDPALWAIVAPIIFPMLVLIPVFLKWKKIGESIGVDWS